MCVGAAGTSHGQQSGRLVTLPHLTPSQVSTSYSTSPRDAPDKGSAGGDVLCAAASACPLSFAHFGTLRHSWALLDTLGHSLSHRS